MSEAGDILRKAIERANELRDSHIKQVTERAELANDQLINPWKQRVKSVKEAVDVIRNINKEEKDDGSS